ncbi:MAG: hypothetical protein R3C26_00900 [Calditrichia bacterium]
MISWKPILSPTQIQQVASYLTTLQGTNPPNGKNRKVKNIPAAEVEL